MLEAMQMTLVTHPTLLSRVPGGRMMSFRWVMIPGNELAGDGRFVGITTVTKEQWQAHYTAETWHRFAAAKRQFDPNTALTSGAGIF